MSLRSIILTVLLALAGGFAGAAIWQMSGLADANTRAYLLENPELLPEMAAAYEAREKEKRLVEVAGKVSAPFPGMVLGNPEGSVTLVEFTDYQCGYCRQSRADVAALIADNPDLRVVVREWPVFEGSEAAARMALAAAKQNKFAAFHEAMFAAGRVSPGSIDAAARQAGLDMDRARVTAASDEVTREIAETMTLAERLGFTGTPSWVAGNRIVEGAVGKDRLAEALANPAPEPSGA
ncbi:hypothetical protein HME9302_02438 [Alteripontixanthobacter maritimus]|uniref:Thioredoxin domain-containing protein n=1 Tax=Alteripontixanthobacter maritimus TaxID=2161824 RepID=A0A369QE79_9SPHN|nr:DsbA family protein [Alteripontixanthobacter maritimus]RDC61219.1 hypothetical protein HME9302_02438 [Alteripontixanthobacter maritimus]